MTAQQRLATYGVSMQTAFDFVVANLSTPQIIVDVSKQFGLTNVMLAEIVGIGIPNVTADVVKSFFAGQGIDSSLLDSSQTMSSVVSQAQDKTNTISTYDSTALLTGSSSVVQSLESTERWQSTSITYSYNNSIPKEYYAISTSPSTISGDLTTGWQSMSSQLRTITDNIINDINQVIGLNISYTTGVGDIRFNMVPTSNSAAAFSYFPYYGTALAGDVFIDTNIDTSTSYLSNGGYGDLVITHELGHAFGLKHPFQDGVTLGASEDHRVNSIMSYTDYKSVVPAFSSNKTTGSVSVEYERTFAHSFMVYDVAALQYKYGVNESTATGNTTYPFDTTPFYKSIWDAGGVDTLDFSLTTATNNIRLTSGSYSDVNYRTVATQIIDQQNTYYQELGTRYHDDWVASVYNVNATQIYTGQNALGIAYGTVIENAIGGSGVDRFYDNAVDNVFWGGAGDDSFYLGEGGFDTIYGEEGTDQLVLSLRKADVQLETQVAGETYLLANDFGVKLVGIEYIQFADQLYQV
ncbi:MAG: M10 family metallopeptidase C-terminal domain-containing protein [Gammaproteobacteria bacterium]|nr:M10 family metallopeptidase C-terminal domain-containing protein [Gammaproteobacteria bacterium]